MAIEDIKNIIKTEAEKRGLDPKTLLALAQIESNYNPNAKNSIGASGLFQFMPETAKQYKLGNPFDPTANSSAAAQMFSENLAKFKDPILAAAAHNSGAGTVQKFGYDFSRYPKETQNYIRKFQALTGFAPNQSTGQEPPTQNMSYNNLTQAQTEPTVPQSTQAPSINPLAFLQPTEAPGKLDTLSKILSGVAVGGGTIANILGAIRNAPGAGNAAIESGTGLLNGLNKKQAEQRKVSQLNQLLQNPALPENLRAAIGLSASGVPDQIVSNLIAPKDNSLENMIKMVGLKSDLQSLEANNPQNKLAFEASKDKQALDIKNAAQQQKIAELTALQAKPPEQLTPDEKIKLAVLKEDFSPKTSSRNLSADQANTLADAQSSLNLLAGLPEVFSNIKGPTGPVAGYLRSLNPYDSEAQKVQASLSSVKQAIGKLLEGGVLRKEDEAKYNKILPTMQDLPEVQAKKVQILQKLLAYKYNAYLDNYSKSNFDVSNFKKVEISPDEYKTAQKFDSTGDVKLLGLSQPDEGGSSSKAKPIEQKSPASDAELMNMYLKLKAKRGE